MGRAPKLLLWLKPVVGCFWATGPRICAIALPAKSSAKDSNAGQTAESTEVRGAALFPGPGNVEHDPGIIVRA